MNYYKRVIRPRYAARKQAYEAYLRSPAWREKRAAAIERDGGRCRAAGCGSSVNLQVHHLRYPKRMGDEPLDWLVTLCERHHMMLHRGRKKKGKKAMTRVVLEGDARGWAPGSGPRRGGEVISERRRW